MKEYRFFEVDDVLREYLYSFDNVVEDLFDGQPCVIVYGEGVEIPEGSVCVVKDVAETGWEDAWKDFLTEGNLTDDIRYAYEKRDFDKPTILLNPGLAFGTGGHPTTRCAARLLSPVSCGASVLDIGTGSGILALCASRSGAKEVYGCDTDDAAIQNASHNVVANDAKNIHLFVGGVESISFISDIDVVVANIISGVLLEIDDNVKSIKPKMIVYSGILSEEFDEVFSRLCKYPYTFDDKISIDGWCGFRMCLTQSSCDTGRSV